MTFRRKSTVKATSSSRGGKYYDDSEQSSWVPNIKRRRRFSTEEAQILESEYAKNSSPTQERIQTIADRISTPRKIVTTWFQNRRAKVRRREKIKREKRAATRGRASSYSGSSSPGFKHDDEYNDEYEDYNELDGIFYGDENDENFEISRQESPEEDHDSGDGDQSDFYDQHPVNQQQQQQKQVPISLTDDYDLSLTASTTLVAPLLPAQQIKQYHSSTSHAPQSFFSAGQDNTSLPNQQSCTTKQNNQHYNINIYNSTNNYFRPRQQDSFFYSPLPQHPHDQYGDASAAGTFFAAMNHHQQPQPPPDWFKGINQQQQQSQNDTTPLFMSNGYRTTSTPFFMSSNTYMNPFFDMAYNCDEIFTASSSTCVNPNDLYLNFQLPYDHHQQYSYHQIKEKEEYEDEEDN